MARKLFVVARGNTTDYESLRRALAGERDVRVIFDRRHGSAPRPGSEMRRNRRAQAELEAQGWCVVTLREDR